MSRECTCYCQVCACREFAKALGKKCKLKCPVCQRVADRIVVNDAVDDERVPSLRRCKSAVIVLEKLDEEISGVHRAMVPVRRESSSHTVAEDGPNTQKELVASRHNQIVFPIRKLCEKAPPALHRAVPLRRGSLSQTVAKSKRNEQKDLVNRRYNEAMCACRKLEEIPSTDHRAKLPSRQETPRQIVAKRRQDAQRSLTLRRYVEALCALKKLVDAVSDYCGAEVQLQQEPSSQIVEEGSQNMQTYSVMGLCENAMSALEKKADELLGNCETAISGHQEPTSHTVAEGKQNTQRGDSTKRPYEKTEAAIRKLYKAMSASTAVETPIQKAPTAQIVVKNTWTLRQVPLLHRCDSATFSWDTQCPICQMSPDVKHESKCVSSRLKSCVAPQYRCNRQHLCYCIERYSKKIVRKLKGRETRVCPFPFCRKQVDRVIMNAAPWKPRTVEKEIKECVLCKAKKEASKAAEQTQKTKGSSSTSKEAARRTGDSTQKTRGSTSKTTEASKPADRTKKTKVPIPKTKEEASKSADRTQKTKAPTTKDKRETSKAVDRAQRTKTSAPKGKERRQQVGRSYEEEAKAHRPRQRILTQKQQYPHVPPSMETRKSNSQHPF